MIISMLYFFFFQAEDGIRDVERSRGLGDVYKRQWDYSGIYIKKMLDKSKARKALEKEKRKKG